MIKEIKSEITYVFWMCVILAVGVLSCIANNHYYTWEEEYTSWTFNENPQEGSGWIDSIVDKTKFK